MPTGWFKAEDIRKMHTYREAIRGRRCGRQKPVASVWVLYPGTETVFFDEVRGAHSWSCPRILRVCAAWVRFRWYLANRASNLRGW